MSNSGVTNIGARSGHLLAATLMALLLLALPMSAYGGDSDRAMPFDILPQALSSALGQFSDQGGVQFTAPGTLLQGLETPGVHGNYAPGAALAAMLRNTGLTYRFIDQRTVAIIRSNGQTGKGASMQPHGSAVRGNTAFSAGSTADSIPALPKVTIEGAREQELLHKAEKFVHQAIVIPDWDSTLLRWRAPICPLAAGLPKSTGEYVLERISQAARDAGAPLDGRLCNPNLYVVATDHPDLLLKKWWARNPLIFHTQHGLPPIRRFIHSRLPIRIWYNTRLGCAQGASAASTGSAAALGSIGTTSAPGARGAGPPFCAGEGAHLSAVVESITSVIIVIDLRQMKDTTLEQMADYVALISLAQVHPDAGDSSEPSILRLFGHAKLPQEMTVWDRGLLYALYNTSQCPMHRACAWLQEYEMQLMMVKRFEGRAMAPPSAP
jgi:hypothetical protein